MRINFAIAGDMAEFHWNPVTGHTTITVDGRTERLQSGLNPQSHFNPSATRRWQHMANGHRTDVVMKKPRLFAGFRSKHFTVEVDGTIVKTARGF